MARSARELSELHVEIVGRNQKLLDQSRAALASSRLNSNELSETVRRTRTLLIDSRLWMEEHPTKR